MKNYFPIRKTNKLSKQILIQPMFVDQRLKSPKKIKGLGENYSWSQNTILRSVEKDLKKDKTILYFHGNAGDLTNRVHKLNELNKLNVNILIISWRGFSGNLGKPTEKNLYNDARKSVEWLNKAGVISKNIILYGESLGTGIATELGQDNSFAGIVLESPFTSIADAAKIYYPYLPIDLLIKDRYDSLKKVKNINTPILVMHGKKDDVVPFKMGAELFEKANQPKFSYFSENDDHMMEFNDQLMNTLRKFLDFNT